MWLLHGTTRRRAEAILAGVPDIRFKEPGGVVVAENVSFCVEGHVSVLRPAEVYARGKASAFPTEGGAAILAVNVPEAVVEAAAREVMGPLLSYLAARTGDEEEEAPDLPALIRQYLFSAPCRLTPLSPE